MSRWTPGTPVALSTERFDIRSLTPGDGIDCQIAWLRDPYVTRFLNPRQRANDSSTVADYVASHDNDRTFLLGVFDRRTGAHVGNHRIEVVENTAWLGVLIGDTDYWGQGVLSETRTAVVDFTFAHLEVATVQGRVAVRNLAVIASYLRLGFEPQYVAGASQVPDGDDLSESIVFVVSKDSWRVDVRTAATPVRGRVDASWFVAAALGIGVDEVSREDHLGSVRKWDSLGHLELIQALESELGREMSTDEILVTTTVEAIGQLLDQAPRTSDRDRPHGFANEG